MLKSKSSHVEQMFHTQPIFVFRYYLVNDPKKMKAKWKRKGVKLHLFNGHVFVAKHLSSSLACQVCSKIFARRFGKQGYQCRDCGWITHKRCHINTPTSCPESSILTMQFEVNSNGQEDTSTEKPLSIPEVRIILSDETDQSI